MGKNILRFLVFLALNTNIHFSTGQTIISGGEASGIWSEAKAPYVIQGNVVVPRDSTLRIGPGVRVEFDGYYGIEVRGRLLAAGTEMDSIFFTVTDTTGFGERDTTLGGWNGILFENLDQSQDSSKLRYCRFEYGKAVAASWPFNAGGVLRVMNFGKIGLENCTFSCNLAGGANGSSGGAAYLAWSPIRIAGNVFINNQARDGGAIHLYASDVTFERNRFEGNTAVNGGGIFIAESSPFFSGDTITGNTSSNSGGGIQGHGSAKHEVVLLEDVHFRENTSDWGGACGFARMHLHMNSIQFEKNFAHWLGGAIAADYCTLQVSNTGFLLDSTFDSGGAIHMDHVKGSFDNCSFTRNTAFNGGSVNAFFSDLAFDSCTFHENHADWNGGALHLINSSMHLESGNFDQNEAIQNGGAVFKLIDSLNNGQPVRVTMRNSLFTGNSGIFSGGAMYLSQTQEERLSSLEIEHCRFIGNYSERNSAFLFYGFDGLIFSGNEVAVNQSGIRTSGAIFNACSGMVVNSIFAGNSSPSGTAGCGLVTRSEIHFMNCLFAGNVSPFAGGLHIRNGSVATLTNCILWENHPTQLMLSTNVDTLGCRVYLNYSVVQNGLDSVVLDEQGEMFWGEGMMTVNPVFTNVYDYDFHLMDQSPCIGAGIPSIEINGWQLAIPAYDIESNPRPAPAGTRPDIGPYESPLGLPVRITGVKKEECRANIFPNPSSGEIQLAIELYRPLNLEIAVLDILGSIVKRFDAVQCEKGRSALKLEIGELPSGQYFLSLISDGKTILALPLQVQ